MTNNSGSLSFWRMVGSILVAIAIVAAISAVIYACWYNSDAQVIKRADELQKGFKRDMNDIQRKIDYLESLKD